MQLLEYTCENPFFSLLQQIQAGVITSSHKPEQIFGLVDSGSELSLAALGLRDDPSDLRFLF